MILHIALWSILAATTQYTLGGLYTMKIYFSVLETGSRDQGTSMVEWRPSSTSQTSHVSSHGLHGGLFYKDTNLLDGAPPSKSNHPQSSHLLIPSPLGFKISAYELGGHMNIQIIAHIEVKIWVKLNTAPGLEPRHIWESRVTNKNVSEKLNWQEVHSHPSVSLTSFRQSLFTPV